MNVIVFETRQVTIEDIYTDATDLWSEQMRFSHSASTNTTQTQFSRQCTRRRGFEAPSLAWQVNVIVPETRQVIIKVIYTDATGL